MTQTDSHKKLDGMMAIYPSHKKLDDIVTIYPSHKKLEETETDSHCFFFGDGGLNGPTSGCTKCKIRPPAILENLE